MRRRFAVPFIVVSALVFGQSPTAQAQDAAALEAQYKTCAKHYIPADKCTPEIYQPTEGQGRSSLGPNYSFGSRCRQGLPRLG